MKNNLIYALVDPRNDVVVYIGKTTNGIKRPLSHINYSHNKKVNNWVNELNADRLYPTIRIVEEGIPLEELPSREVYWINEYYQANPEMFNSKLIYANDLVYDFHINYDEITCAKLLLSNIPKFLKSLRYIHRITQESLAERLDISRSTLVLIEQGGDVRSSLLLDIISLAFDLESGKETNLGMQRIRHS